MSKWVEVPKAFTAYALFLVFVQYVFLQIIGIRRILFLILVMYPVQLIWSWFLRLPISQEKSSLKKKEEGSMEPKEDVSITKDSLRKRVRQTRSQTSETSSKADVPTKTKIKFSWSAWVLVLNAVNAVLFAMSCDYAFRDYFMPFHDLEMVKMGMVNTTHAHMFVRAVNDKKVTFSYKKESESEWHQGPVFDVAAENDHVVNAALGDLQPNTQYRVRWTGASNTSLSYRDLTFKTFPEGFKKLKFVYSSCVRPNFPYGIREIKGFRQMAKKHPDFVLFLGDLVYVDYPMYFGDDLESYRSHYRRVFQNPDSQTLFSSTPSFFIYDDHEIFNDWNKFDQHPFVTALQAFNEWAGFGNPTTFDPRKNGGVYFTYDFGTAASFFVMDTRRYRDSEHGKMLGDVQMAAFKRWLLESQAAFKIIVSSVPFTINFSVNGKDTWQAFQEERDSILQFIKENNIKNVVVLSGDRHEVAVTKFPGDVIEFSTSPVLQFYSPIETYKETGEDKKVFTWRYGNIKWAAVEVDRDAQGAFLKYSLYVNDVSGKTMLFLFI